MSTNTDLIAAAVAELSGEHAAITAFGCARELAAVFVAAARHREAVAVCLEASRGDDDEAYRKACIELDASAAELDAALARAAEAVMR